MQTLPHTASPEPPSRKRPVKTWHAGTLTYTTGGLVVLFCWLLWGDLAWSFRERATPGVMQVLLKKFDASDTFTAICFGSLPPALTMIITPVISYLSDRHRGPRGRRIPYMLLTTPLFVISLLGLAFAPAIGTALYKVPGFATFGLNGVVLLLLMISWTLYDLSNCMATPIYGGLVNDVVPEPVLGRFFALFRSLSLFAGAVFNYWIFGRVENHSTGIFIALAAVFGIGFTLMCVKVKEGQYPPPPPRELGNPAVKALTAVKTFCADCYGKSYYWWFYGAFALCTTTAMPFGLFSFYYARSFHMDNATYGKYGALTLLISLGLAYPIGVLADRFHPLRLGIAVQTLYAVILLMSAIFVVNPWTFNVALVINGVIYGTWATAVASIFQRLMPREKFAQYSAGGVLVVSLFSVLMAPVFGMILDHLHHQYRYTFLLALAFSVAGTLALLVFHSMFMKHGGPERYVAPE